MSKSVHMISVQQAEQIILSCKRDFGPVSTPLLKAVGAFLAEEIAADRDLPPYHRVAMDGIAIRHHDYENGCRAFAISGVVGAGEMPPISLLENSCFEIMTGAARPGETDTIIPYEHLQISDGIARIIHPTVKKGQNIHIQGSDKKQGEVLIRSGKLIGPVEISVAASVGKTELLVRKLPGVAIFSSGDELVDISAIPLPYQIRRTNNYAIHAALQRYGIEATMMHLPDDLEVVKTSLQKATAEFDVIILSGGISMGKFDYIPQALAETGVEQHFHKVRQKPGKPFWFGTYGPSGVVFALPGNPVSTFLCLLRYTIPWLEASLGFPAAAPRYARIDTDVHFKPTLQYFLQVKLTQDETAIMHASPLRNNGSGDYASLLEADGFLELPDTKTTFETGETYRVWRYR